MLLSAVWWAKITFFLLKIKIYNTEAKSSECFPTEDPTIRRSPVRKCLVIGTGNVLWKKMTQWVLTLWNQGNRHYFWFLKMFYFSFKRLLQFYKLMECPRYSTPRGVTPLKMVQRPYDPPHNHVIKGHMSPEGNHSVSSPTDIAPLSCELLRSHRSSVTHMGRELKTAYGR